MPSKRVFKIKRSHFMDVGLEKEIPDQDVLRVGQLEDMMSDVFAMLNPEQGTCVTLDKLSVGPAPSTAAGSKQHANPQSGEGGSSSGTSSGSGSSGSCLGALGFGRAPQQQAASASAKAKAKPSPRKSHASHVAHAASHDPTTSSAKPSHRAKSKTPQAPPVSPAKSVPFSIKRGRPRSDPFSLCRQAVAAFTLVKPDDEKHFGNRRAQIRFLERQLAAMNESSDQLEGTDQKTEAATLKKQVSTILSWCKVIANSGVHSQAFSDELDAKSCFLAMGPSGANPAPAWMFQMRHERKIECESVDKVAGTSVALSNAAAHRDRSSKLI